MQALICIVQKNGEIKRFLDKFFNYNFNLTDDLHWNKEFQNPIEIVDGVLTDCHGKNVDSLIRKSVMEIMERIRDEEIQCAVLQSRSPTCGVNQVYDGTFSGKLIPGSGVFAKSLMDAGYLVIDGEDISQLCKGK